jgi:hypothetical protein
MEIYAIAIGSFIRFFTAFHCVDSTARESLYSCLTFCDCAEDEVRFILCCVVIFVIVQGLTDVSPNGLLLVFVQIGKTVPDSRGKAESVQNFERATFHHCSVRTLNFGPRFFQQQNPYRLTHLFAEDGSAAVAVNGDPIIDANLGGDPANFDE